jgi:osmotically-inducible protein OsmY
MYASTVHNNPVLFQGIAEAATECLQNSPYQAVRRVLCEECDHGILSLRGRLPSFHQKQVAQETVARVKGVTQVINEVEVD